MPSRHVTPVMMPIRRTGDGLHHLIVGWDTYDERVLRRWLEAAVSRAVADDWNGIADQLRFLGRWEFEGYQP